LQYRVVRPGAIAGDCVEVRNIKFGRLETNATGQCDVIADAVRTEVT
jgi:hypothetical protein